MGKFDYVNNTIDTILGIKSDKPEVPTCEVCRKEASELKQEGFIIICETCSKAYEES